MLDLLLVLVLGHLIADFIIQSDKSCQRKSSPIPQHNTWLSAYHLRAVGN